MDQNPETVSIPYSPSSNSIPTTTTKKITVSMPPPHTAPNEDEGALSRQQYPQYKIPLKIYGLIHEIHILQ